MVHFGDIWALPIGTTVEVTNGKPPPSKNIDGMPYKAWLSHNFTGVLEKKMTRKGFRYLVFEVLPETTPDEVEYLAHEIAEQSGHLFEVV